MKNRKLLVPHSAIRFVELVLSPAPVYYVLKLLWPIAALAIFTGASSDAVAETYTEYLLPSWRPDTFREDLNLGVHDVDTMVGAPGDDPRRASIGPHRTVCSSAVSMSCGAVIGRHHAFRTAGSQEAVRLDSPPAPPRSRDSNTVPRHSVKPSDRPPMVVDALCNLQKCTSDELALYSALSSYRYADALPLVERMISDDMDSKELHRTERGSQLHYAARIYEELAYYDKAIDLYRRIEEKQKQSKIGEEVSKKDFWEKMDSSMAKSESITKNHPALRDRMEQLKKTLGDLRSKADKAAEASRAPVVPSYLEARATLLTKMARYPEAIELYQQAIDINNEITRLNPVLAVVPGPLPVAYNYLGLIGTYLKYGDYARARQALAYLKGKLHEWHITDPALLGYSYADLLEELGEYREAEQYLKKALTYWDRTDRDSTALHYLNRLAAVYRKMGRFADASQLYSEALEVPKTILVTIPAHLAWTLNESGTLEMEQGMYTAAQSTFRQALKIQERHFGRDHPLGATTLTNLAHLHQQQGNDSEALANLSQALEITMNRLGEDHPDTAAGLVELARLYRQLARNDPQHYLQAMERYEKALKIRESRLMPGHRLIAETLTELSRLKLDMGDQNSASELAERAVDVWERAGRQDDPEAALSLLALANSNFAQKDYERAEANYLTARALGEKSFGMGHPFLAQALLGLSRLAFIHERPEEGLSLLKSATELENKLLQRQLGTARENRKLELLNAAADTFYILINTVVKYFPYDATAKRFVLDTLLARKGLIFDDQARIEEALASDLAPSLKSKWQQLRRQLATLELHPPLNTSSHDMRQLHTRVQADLEEVEAHIGAKSQRFSQHRFRRDVTASRVAATLPSNGVLVEFVKTRDIGQSHPRYGDDASRYVAFTLRADGQITMIDLGQSSQIESAIDEFRETLPKGEALHAVPVETVLEKLEALYEKLLLPLERVISDAKQIILSPDEQLNAVPFAALRNERDGKFAVERWTINYVTSGRELMRNDSEPWPKVATANEGNLMMVVDPSYDVPIRGGTPALPSETSNANVARPAASLFEELGHFRRLEETSREADEIIRLKELQSLKKQVFSQDLALEQSIVTARRPLVLHMATHGFFLRGHESFRHIRSENALFRSGIALTGANHAKDANSHFDGLLTAYEVTGMDLHGTDLVVLSACETGLGEYVNGEGVYGLRRAFALSGARHLIMSLWKVDDAMTARQMVSFYKQYGQGNSVAESLRSAQLAAIEDLRAKHGEASPALWAAFIVQGVTRH